MERGKTYPMSELETSLHKENAQLRARIAELEQLANDMSEALDSFDLYDSFESLWSGPEPEVVDKVMTRYREVCGGEK